MQIGLPSSFQINEDLTVLNFQTEQDILGIGSKLNSAYVVIDQEIKTKPSAPTKSCFAWAQISWQNSSRNGTHLKKLQILHEVQYLMYL